jgi:hypothetical protein
MKYPFYSCKIYKNTNIFLNFIYKKKKKKSKKGKEKKEKEKRPAVYFTLDILVIFCLFWKDLRQNPNRK